MTFWDRKLLDGIALRPSSLGGGVSAGIGDGFANLDNVVLKLSSQLVFSDFVVGFFDGCECVLNAALAEVNNREQSATLRLRAAIVEAQLRMQGGVGLFSGGNLRVKQRNGFK